MTGTRVTREVRGFIHDSFRRVAGSAVILRATHPRLEALVVSDREDGHALVERGSQLLEQLAAAREDHDRWDAERVTTADAAKEAAEALRGAVRELRRLWRLARHRSGGALPLHLARSLTTAAREEGGEDES